MDRCTPPVAKKFFRGLLERYLRSAPEHRRLSWCLLENRPVVLVGPYEHHSNEVCWRECYAEVVQIGLASEGLLDLTDLEAKASVPRTGAGARSEPFRRPPTCRGQDAGPGFSAICTVALVSPKQLAAAD